MPIKKQRLTSIAASIQTNKNTTDAVSARVHLKESTTKTKTNGEQWIDGKLFSGKWKKKVTQFVYHLIYLLETVQWTAGIPFQNHQIQELGNFAFNIHFTGRAGYSIP